MRTLVAAGIIHKRPRVTMYHAKFRDIQGRVHDIDGGSRAGVGVRPLTTHDGAGNKLSVSRGAN